MKEKIKRAAMLLVICAMLLPLCIGQARAVEGPDLSGSGSLTITVPEDVVEDLVEQGGQGLIADIFCLTYGASYDAETNSLIYEFMEPFGSMDAEQPLDAQTVAKWMRENRENWGAVQTVPVTDVYNGRYFVTLDNVEPGLYFIFIRPDIYEFESDDYFHTLNGGLCTASPAGGDEFWFFAPWLVSVPAFRNSADGGVWDIGVEADFKPDKHGDEEESRTITFKKVDSTDGATPLAGAEFKLYTAAAEPNDEDFLEVYVQGMGKVTLYPQYSGLDDIGTYITGDDGLIEIEVPAGLPPYTLCALVEVTAPAGYIGPEEPYYFYVDDLVIKDDEGEVLDGNSLVIGGQPVYGDRGWSKEPLTEGLIWKETDEDGKKTFAIKNTTGETVFVRIAVLSPVMWNNFSAGGPWQFGQDGYYIEYMESLGSGEETGEFQVAAGSVVIYEMCKLNAHGQADWDDRDAIMTNDLAADSYTGTVHLLTAGARFTAIGNDPDGEELPETGGKGTTVFYILGSLLLIGALAAPAVKKRITAA